MVCIDQKGCQMHMHTLYVLNKSLRNICVYQGKRFTNLGRVR